MFLALILLLNSIHHISLKSPLIGIYQHITILKSIISELKDKLDKIENITLDEINSDDVDSKIDDTVLFFKAEYNKEVRKIKLSEIEVQLRKYKNLIQELLKDYEQNYISQSNYTDFKEKYMLQINKLNIEKEELLKNKINSSININSKFKSEYKAYLGILKINNML